MDRSWVIMVRDQNFRHCVLVACVLLNAIIERLGPFARIDYSALLDSSVLPLDRYLARQARKANIKRFTWWGASLLATAAVSGLIGAFIMRLV